jgi:peptidyl-prolyl cis-trans isomerase C
MRALPPALLIASLGLLGCKGGASETKPALDTSNAVVRVDDTIIDTTAVEHHLGRLPAPVRARYASAEGKKELVDNLVRFELLANEARRQGIDRRPEVQRLVKQQMINLLLEQGAGSATTEPSDEAAEKYYRDNPALFQRGEQVRVAHIRVQDPATAQKVAIAARRVRPNSDGFDKLVKQYSDDGATKDRKGDLGFLERGSADHSPTLVAAAFALPEAGATTDPVETDKGFHILRLTEKKPAAPAPFADVKAEVKARLAQQARDKQVTQLIEQLRGKAKIEVFDQRLQQALAAPAPPTAAAH